MKQLYLILVCLLIIMLWPNAVNNNERTPTIINILATTKTLNIIATDEENVNPQAEEIAKRLIAYEHLTIEAKTLQRVEKKIRRLMPNLETELVTEFAIAISKAVLLYSHLQEDDIISMIYVESRFNADAMGDRKKYRRCRHSADCYWAFGPMQVHTYFWNHILEDLGDGFTPEDLMTIKGGIIIGSWYVNDLIRRKGRRRGIQCYNTAIGSEYVTRVMRVRRRIAGI